MIREERRFRRKVEPFEDIEVNVDLQDMLQEGRSPAPYCHVAPLADWIEDEWVRLRVVSLPHSMSRELLIHVDAGNMPERFMSGGSSHRRLCSLATAYLISAGKFDEPRFTKRDAEQERVLSTVERVLREQLPYSWENGHVREAFLLAAKRVREGKR